jgi:hypothetical protein
MRTIHILVSLFFFSEILSAISYIQITNVFGSHICTNNKAAMDQADTRAYQNHHFGMCFPPPHFQVSAIHNKSMTETREKIST